MKDLQLKNGVAENDTLQLIQDVSSRWTTKVDMVERYLLLAEYMYSAMNECNNPIEVLTREESKVIQEFFEVTRHVRDSISEVSGEKYATSSIIIPLVHGIRSSIEDTSVETSYIKDFKCKI